MWTWLLIRLGVGVVSNPDVYLDLQATDSSTVDLAATDSSIVDLEATL